MKKGLVVLILLFIVCIFSNASGQNSKVDSLKQVMEQARQDTTQARLNIEIGTIFLNQNPDTAFHYFKHALNLSEKALEGSENSQTKSDLIFRKLKAVALLKIGIVYYYHGDYNKAIDYYNQSLAISEKLGELKGIYYSANNIGLIYTNQGDYEKALEYLNRALKSAESLKDSVGVSNCYANIGGIYSQMSIYDKAIEYYLKALKVFERVGNEMGKCSCYNNIALIYSNLSDFDKAIGYYFRALKIAEKLGNKISTAQILMNIGNIFYHQNNNEKATDYFNQSLRIAEEIGDKMGMAKNNLSIGLIQHSKGNYNKANEYYFKSLQLTKLLGDKNEMAIVYENIASSYYALATSRFNNEHDSDLIHALYYGHKAFNLSHHQKDIRVENYAAKLLLDIYTKIGNFKKAVEYANAYMITRDSLFSEAKNKEINGLQLNYERDKNIREKAILEKDKAIILEKTKRQRVVILSISIGFVLLVFMITFILRRLQITRRQKRIIEEKNNLLNEKNEEISAQRDEIESQRDLVVTQRDRIETQSQKITDSITYAQRIQQAVLPSGNAIEDILGDHFILFKPKDIVSGDFYWATRSNEHLFVAVADCTGHGVPGAFMSMLGITLLNEIVRRKENFNAAEVLDRLRELMIEALKQKGIIGEQKDGMDMAFCILNIQTNMLQYAGANISLNIVSVNRELTVVGADKQPVAIFVKMKPFTNHDIPLLKGDCIYLASDGFKDQFGGPQGKKYMVKRFSELLMSIAEKPMEEQRQLLDHTFESWRGDQEQVDDLTILGVRV